MPKKSLNQLIKEYKEVILKIRTKTICKAMNKLIWDNLMYGFVIMVVVMIASHSPLLYGAYQYSEGEQINISPSYNPLNLSFQEITEQDEFRINPLNVSKDNPQVVFIELLNKRVMLIAYLMIFGMLIELFLKYRKKIERELIFIKGNSPQVQRLYVRLKQFVEEFFKFINW